MRQKECVTMVLAGGKGTRLGALTSNIAKPAVYFGSKYRLIDFTLSNCAHSDMDTLGVLTQYSPTELHNYINSGHTWDLDKLDGGVFLLPSSKNSRLYTGTANAVYQNMAFIEQFNPKYVLILSADHIYKMDYGKMLNFHKQTGADATVAVTALPFEETSRFGVLRLGKDSSIHSFVEKPKQPPSNIVSMGIYMFKWSRLKRYLMLDKYTPGSKNDFARNIIPSMLTSGEKLYAYRFDGYWKDAGTVESLWESNMDLLSGKVGFYLSEKDWEIFTKHDHLAPCIVFDKAKIKRSVIADGCTIKGSVTNSVLSDSVHIEEGAEIIDSVIMPGAVIGKNALVRKAIIGAGAVIGDNVEIGANKGLSLFYDNTICSKDISLVGHGVHIYKNIKILKNSHIDKNVLPMENQKLILNKETARLRLITAPTYDGAGLQTGLV